MGPAAPEFSRNDRHVTKLTRRREMGSETPSKGDHRQRVPPPLFVYAVAMLLQTARDALRDVKEWPAPRDPDILRLSLTVFFPVPTE